MQNSRWTALVVAASLVLSATATAASTHRRWIHPPIHVATPSHSPITPYFFVYGSRYRYNSPGPVYDRLDYWGPDSNGCRLWRYNYLYWVC
jgi:hypothetical protein